MAQIWDNEPAGLGLASACFQDIQCPSPAMNSFPSRKYALSSINLPAPKIQTILDWTAPIWLSNLCQILKVRLEYLEKLQGATSRISLAPSILPPAAIEEQQAKPSTQTQGEAAMPYLSTPTDHTYVLHFHQLLSCIQFEFLMAAFFAFNLLCLLVGQKHSAISTFNDSHPRTV